MHPCATCSLVSKCRRTGNLNYSSLIETATLLYPQGFWSVVTNIRMLAERSGAEPN